MIPSKVDRLNINSVILEVLCLEKRFTPQEKEQACIDYIEGNRPRSEICSELHISTRTIQDCAHIKKIWKLQDLQKKPKSFLFKTIKIEALKNIYVVKHRQLN